MRPIVQSVIMPAAMGADNRPLNLPPGRYPGNRAGSIAPAVMSGNHPAMKPGGRRVVRTEAAGADARGERPAVAVEGFNVAAGR